MRCTDSRIRLETTAATLLGIALFAATSSTVVSANAAPPVDQPTPREDIESTARVLVGVRPGMLDEAMELLKPLGAECLAPGSSIWSLPADPGRLDALARELVACDAVRFACPDRLVHSIGGNGADPGIPNDPDLALQWFHQSVDSQGAWAIAPADPSVVIAIVDTGIKLSHTEFQGVLVPGYNSYWRPGQARLAQVDGGIVDDANGHGTGVAGVAAALGDNDFGGAGVGWGASLMPIRATDPGSSFDSATTGNIIAGIMWAAANGAKVINVSFNGGAEPLAESVGSDVRAMGALLIWPIDNSGVDYGATFDHPNTTTVAGIDDLDQLTDSSSFGQGVDLVAPATGMWVPAPNGAYLYRFGNSFAGPVVAGAAARIFSVVPGISPTEVEWAMLVSADDLGDPGEDDVFGAGRLNAAEAVRRAILQSYCKGSLTKPQVLALLDEQTIALYAGGALDINADGAINAFDTTCIARLLCRADWNLDGSLNEQDFFDFVNDFFDVANLADFDGDGAENDQDFFDFVNAFFTGC